MTLNLHIIGQKIYCDEVPFLATESKNYLKCKFEFSTDWEGCIKTAIFRGVTGVPYCVEIKDDACTVPHEVLTGNVFLISVFGILDDKRITTNTVDIYVKDSGYAEGETPPAPTPTVYEKMLKELHTINTIQQEELDNKAGKTELANLSSELKKKVDSDTYSSDINGIRAEVSDLGDNIDTHTTDTQKHISADERALWNDNVEQTKQNQEAISNIKGHIGDIYDMVHVNKNNIEALQTQADSIEAALDTKAKQSDIGDISRLPTGSENVVAEMNELYTMIDNNQLDITSLQYQMGDVETALDNKVDKTEWELLETITADGETKSYIRDLVTAYGVSDISAVMLSASYPKNTTSYGIYNSIEFTSDDSNNYSSIYSWTTTLTDKACLHWIVVNKEMGFCYMSKTASDNEVTATIGTEIRGAAVIVKTINGIQLGTFAGTNVTSLIPEGTVFKIYGKGVVRNAEN